MKYTIIVCLLFVLINSKKEIKHKFSLLKGLKGNDYDDDSSCKADTKDKCKALPAPEKDEQCCYYETKADGNVIQKGCEEVSNDELKIGDIYKMKEFKAMQRESMGYNTISEGEAFPYKKIAQTLTCKSGGYSLELDTNFSDKEKKILGDDKHCLKISEKKEDDISYNVGECKNYVLTDNAKNNGVDCGYFRMNITLDTKETVTSTTCSLFNLKAIQKMANLNPENLFDEDDARDIIDEMGKEGNVVSFVAEAYNGKGKRISYDSTTKKIVVEGSGFMLTASKYLFLLFLILF